MAHGFHLKSICSGWVLTILALKTVAAAEPAPSAPSAPLAASAAASSPGKGRIIALVAAVGEQFTVVRQRESVGSHMEPFSRQTLNVDTQALNFAVLRGLDQALAREEPDSQRVMLQWVTPDATREALRKAYKADRSDVLLNAIREYLRMVPEHEQWDRVEVVVPHYSFIDRDGMGTKLDGIGVYVQPLQSVDVSLDATGNISTTNTDGDFKTIDPNSGNHGKESTFVAPYFYFDRVTLDAHTLAVIARKSQFDDVKYNDPNSPALDVMKQMPAAVLLQHVADLVEHSAYQSVRGKQDEITVGPVVPVPASAGASATVPRQP